MQVLPYTSAVSKIKDGDIVFMRNRGKISRIVQFLTRSNYSHVGIAFWARIGDNYRVMIIESQRGTKRRIQNLSVYADNDLDIVPAPTEFIMYEEQAFSELGIKKYNSIEAIYIGIREFIFKKIGWRLPHAKFSGEICSEFIARLLDLKDTTVSPQGLYEQLLDLGHDVAIQVRK
jgi:hypothetical protein